MATVSPATVPLPTNQHHLLLACPSRQKQCRFIALQSDAKSGFKLRNRHGHNHARPACAVSPASTCRALVFCPHSYPANADWCLPRCTRRRPCSAIGPRRTVALSRCSAAGRSHGLPGRFLPFGLYLLRNAGARPFYRQSPSRAEGQGVFEVASHLTCIWAVN
mgnify:CR=1 FL=1